MRGILQDSPSLVKPCRQIQRYGNRAVRPSSGAVVRFSPEQAAVSPIYVCGVRAANLHLEDWRLSIWGRRVAGSGELRTAVVEDGLDTPVYVWHTAVVWPKTLPSHSHKRARLRGGLAGSLPQNNAWGEAADNGPRGASYPGDAGRLSSSGSVARL